MGVMKTTDFKKDARVRVTSKYPVDHDYPIAHSADADLWGLIGMVAVSDYGYVDEKYVHVVPLGMYNDWPKKERFDPLPEWHFLPEELEKVN